MSFRISALAFAGLAVLCPSILFADSATAHKSLEILKTPLPETLFGIFEVAPKDVCSWMDDIEATLLTTKYEFSILSEVSQVQLFRGKQTPFVNAVSVRYGHDPESLAERFIAHKQSMLDSPSLSVRSGAIRDGATQFDYVKTSAGAWLASVVDFGGSIASTPRTFEPSKTSTIKKTSMFFHPVRACTAGVAQTANGGCMEAGSHNVRMKTIAGSVAVGSFVHILLEFPDEERRTYQLITFLEKKPVQYVSYFRNGPQGTPLERYETTRSAWKDVGDNVVLPVKLQATRNTSWDTGELRSTISWKIEGQVDRRLFDKDSLGLLPTVIDHSHPLISD